MSDARPPRYHGLLGLVVLAVSEALMLAGVPPFSTWFYSLAWWSYIFAVDQAVYSLTGNSLWVSRRGEFLRLIPLSVLFWMIFEGLNVYLRNWLYVGVTPEAWLRWFGYFLAYGTVLPGIFETYELLLALGVGAGWRVGPLTKTTAWYWPFILAGLFFLFGPIIWPEYLFPLVWGAFILLGEPLLHARGGPSLMRDWENGQPRVVLLLLLAGFICGGLWEFWNYWAETKWVYQVPYVGFLKIFEMPLLGFGGFPPFAVELYVMTNMAALVRGGRNWPREWARLPATTPAWATWLYLLAWSAVFIAVGRSIDSYTIISWH